MQAYLFYTLTKTEMGAMINIHKRLSTIVAMIINHCFCLGTD